MNALTLVFATLCLFAIAYRFYGLWIAQKVLGVRADRPTPSETLADGHDYVKTNRFVVFGHHFAAIAAAGPLLGPVLAAQFGYLPGALWILIGCVLGGAVHDMVVLFASVRHKGQSLASIASKEIGTVAGKAASFAVLFILLLTLAGLSLAVGMAHIFSSIPFFKHLMAYWYHFAIMFEAVFILTAVDTGTRVGRFFLQEMLGQLWPRFAEPRWWPGILLTSALFTGAWGYLVYTGDIGTIWPLFGMSNQLLAACGLIVGTTLLIRMGKARNAWITAVPGLAMAVVTFWVGWLNVTNNYLPRGLYLLATIAVVVMGLMAVVFVNALARWRDLLKIETTVMDSWGEAVLEPLKE